jgi:hypothetical protein
MQAWGIDTAMDLCAEPTLAPTTQTRYVAALYKDDRIGMSVLAGDIESLQQIRARVATAAPT